VEEDTVVVVEEEEEGMIMAVTNMVTDLAVAAVPTSKIRGEPLIIDLSLWLLLCVGECVLVTTRSGHYSLIQYTIHFNTIQSNTIQYLL